MEWFLPQPALVSLLYRTRFVESMKISFPVSFLRDLGLRRRHLAKLSSLMNSLKEALEGRCYVDEIFQWGELPMVAAIFRS